MADAVVDAAPACHHLRRGRDSRMRLSSRDDGQGLVEYALILVLVAIVVLVILALLGPTLGDFVNDVVEIIRDIFS
jgi:pilus assembly protein Flp/PilA